MLTLSTLREHKEEVKEKLGVKNFTSINLIDEVIKLDEDKRKLQVKLDASLAEMNTAAKQIGILFGQNKKQEAEALRQKTTNLKEKNKILSDQFQELEHQIKEILLSIPNLPNNSVSKGNSDTDNEVIFESENKLLGSKALPHWDITDTYKLIDFEAGNKITGSGFPLYTGKGAKLQRALISFFLDQAAEAGYQEMTPPLLVNEASGFGTGQLPDKEGQMYHVKDDNLYLIPTAEVPLTNIYRDTILDEKDFPIKITGYTPCFRREAGSYGKDVRGLNRLHQFDKVEIVQIEHPEKSYETLSNMVTYVESIVQKLELPYRILRLCGGDLSFASALTFDFEVYAAGQDKWLEVSSVSNFESFQANRLKLRYKDTNNKKHFAHTLNGSALALPRIVAALLENNQTENGIKIPTALVKYTGFEYIN